MSAPNGAPLPAPEVCGFRELRIRLARSCANNEQTRPRLGNAEVRCIQHFPPAPIASIGDLLEEPRERGAARSVVKGQRVNVLENEVSWSGFGEYARVCLEETCGW